MPAVHVDPMPPLRHNTILPEYPCSGEVIERKEFSMGQVRVAICSACGTEFQYVPDSDWLKVIAPGNAKPDLVRCDFCEPWFFRVGNFHREVAFQGHDIGVVRVKQRGVLQVA